jgi:hypothetical protein
MSIGVNIRAEPDVQSVEPVNGRRTLAVAEAVGQVPPAPVVIDDCTARQHETREVLRQLQRVGMQGDQLVVGLEIPLTSSGAQFEPAFEILVDGCATQHLTERTALGKGLAQQAVLGMPRERRGRLSGIRVRLNGSRRNPRECADQAAGE